MYDRVSGRTASFDLGAVKFSELVFPCLGAANKHIDDSLLLFVAKTAFATTTVFVATTAETSVTPNKFHYSTKFAARCFAASCASTCYYSSCRGQCPPAS